MAQSTWYPFGYAEMDFIGPNTHYGNQWDVGVLYLGGPKAVLRRVIAGFDVFAAPASGRPLTAADVITAAELIEEVTVIQGGSGWGMSVNRVTRADWDPNTVTWNDYRAGSAWTAGGGDFGTPPAALSLNSPTATGERIISGLAPYVTDAIASRGGKVHLLLKADAENPGVDRMYSVEDTVSNALRPRLRVTYESQAPSSVAWPEPDSTHGAQRPAGASPPATPHPPARPARPAP